jgi:hypothetical protein
VNQERKNTAAEALPNASGQTAEKRYGRLTCRPAMETDLSYIKDLAFSEIGIMPRRLHLNKTDLIYLDRIRIGFISYCRINQTLFYIYMMALEKEAQNHGLASPIVRWTLRREERTAPIEGIMFRIYKTNQQALHATLEKYNYQIIKEMPEFYVLHKKWPPAVS